MTRILRQIRLVALCAGSELPGALASLAAPAPLQDWLPAMVARQRRIQMRVRDAAARTRQAVARQLLLDIYGSSRCGRRANWLSCRSPGRATSAAATSKRRITSNSDRAPRGTTMATASSTVC